MSTFKYRPDIDGLRAIAVVSVVIFHINPKWLPSGFLGVDIFFVLSGFLITSIIYKEMQEGRFSFKEFYIRRIKRILPLFFVVLMTGMLVSRYVFMPNDNIGVIDSAISSLMFLANRHFARQGGYFDIASDEKPFLHLWSLSIEEQFYFIFPLFLLLVFNISFLRKNILKVLGLGILLSLFSAFIDLTRVGIFWDAYYLSHIRAGEMLIGSFLAVYNSEKRKINEEKQYVVIVISLIFLGCFFLDEVFVEPYFPGILALIPCGLVALLIYINENKNWVSSFLSSKLMVWIGKISYSLYLWHWVVLAIMRYIYQGSELPILWNILAIIMMLVLSVVTYHFIENPLRKLQWSFKKNLFCFYIVPSGIVLVLTYILKNNYSIPKELNYPENICHNTIKENCIKGDTTKKPKLLFIGNSHMGQLNPWIDKVGKAEGWSAVVVSSDSFPFAFEMEWDKEKFPFYYKKAKERDEFFMENYQDYPIIVLNYDQRKEKEFHPKFLETIKKLREENKKVYILANVVRANISPLKYYSFSSKSLSFRDLEMVKEENVLNFIPNDFGVRKIDLTAFFPKTFFIDGKPVLCDTHHWNVYGAEQMADVFISSGNKFVNPKDLE